jgi:hypothetical protein
MSGPFPPQGWGDQNSGPGGYGGYDNRGMPGTPPGGYYGAEPPKKKTGAIIALVLVALVLLAGAGAAFFFTRNTSNATGPAPQLVPSSTSSASPTTTARTPQSNPPAESTPTTRPSNSAKKLAPWTIGSCYYYDMRESSGGTATSWVLTPTDCDSRDALLRINKVVADSSGCEGSPNFKALGAYDNDSSAGVTYCDSLMVPQEQCIEMPEGDGMWKRVPCNAKPDVRKVAAIATGQDPIAACGGAGLPNAEPFFHESPSSGRYACLVRTTG